MTTLPTTSSIRLPRSGGPGGQVLAMPAAAMGSPSAQGQEPFLTPADVWRILRRSWLLIIVSLTIAAALGTALWWIQLRVNPRYTSQAQVQIRPPYRVDGRTQSVVGLGEESFDLRVEMRTQMQLLMSENLWMSVLDKNPKIRETNWYQNFQSTVNKKGKESDVTPATLAKQDLADNFRVAPVTDTKLLKITFETSNADDARDVIQYIVDAHITSQQEAASVRTRSDLELAQTWYQRYKRSMDNATSAMSTAKAKLGGNGNIDGRNGGVIEMQLSQMVSEQIKTKFEMNNAKAQLEAFEATFKNNETPAEVDQAVRMDQKVQRVQAALENAQQQLLVLQSAIGPENRSVKAKQAEVDSLTADLSNETRKARGTYRAALLSQAQGMVDKLDGQINALNSQIEEKRTELRDITDNLVEYFSQKEQAETYRVMVRELDDRIASLKNNNMGSERIGISWANNGAPNRPETLSSPKLAIYLPGALMIGLVFSLGIAFLREIMDTSVKSPRDIARVGPMNVLGMIADESDDPQMTGVPLHAVISQAPHSMMAEQFRQVRTRLQHAASLDTTRTIVVTSPGPQDGKSMVSCNLAAGLALNGRRILLVDANFRRPELHRLFGLPNETGFANVLDSVSNLESAVQKSSTPNLDILTTGPKASNPTELLESQLFSDFIDRALEEYDHVIFDTGPLLVVSEAVALAPRVDGVITVVRARVNSRGMLTRVRDTLKQIKAEHLGVVLNGVQSWGGGYYGRNVKTYYAYQNAPE